MKNNILRVCVITALVIVFAGVAVSQGLYWESVTTIQGDESKTMNSSVSYMPKMFKQSMENNASIFRLDKEVMYIINNKDKEYTEMTFSEMEAATKQAMGQMEALKKQMKDMPPEQRKAMEKMLGNTAMGGPAET
jgi:hypothetical protein